MAMTAAERQRKSRQRRKAAKQAELRTYCEELLATDIGHFTPTQLVQIVTAKVLRDLKDGLINSVSAHQSVMRAAELALAETTSGTHHNPIRVTLNVLAQHGLLTDDIKAKLPLPE